MARGYSCNIGPLTNGCIPFISMGPIAYRPSEASGENIKLNSLYISTDEISGKWKMYWFDKRVTGNDNGWNFKCEI